MAFTNIWAKLSVLAAGVPFVQFLGVICPQQIHELADISEMQSFCSTIFQWVGFSCVCNVVECIVFDFKMCLAICHRRNLPYFSDFLLDLRKGLEGQRRKRMGGRGSERDKREGRWKLIWTAPVSKSCYC